jgi:RNA polymerase sigma-70 factor (sigma-E family)
VSSVEKVVTAHGASDGGLGELYERHVGRAVALARVLTGDPHVAEDLAHDAFVRVAGRFRHLRHPDAFDAYLRRAVLNLCRARWRRVRLERAWERRQARREDPAPATYDSLERDAVWGAIEGLPYRQRAAVVLRYYEDLSVESVANVLGCSTRAARSLLARAMATLRQTLKEEQLP